MELNKRETAAVLAGLRVLQNAIHLKWLDRSEKSILTNCGSLKPMSIEEINDLCIKINVGEE